MLNFEEKVRNMESTLNSWKKQKFTLGGRVNIVKTQGLYKLICNTSLLIFEKILSSISFGRARFPK